MPSLLCHSFFPLPLSYVRSWLSIHHSPNLTWRDMQHLSVLTSKRNQLHDEVHQWRRNGVGLEFNHLFGYGVLDAGGMVKMAKEWKTVPERFHCVAGSIQEVQWVTFLFILQFLVPQMLDITCVHCIVHNLKLLFFPKFWKGNPAECKRHNQLITG